MQVLEAIEHAESELATTLDALREAKELVAALEQDAKKMQVEIVGMKSYAQRQGLTAPDLTYSADVVPISANVNLLTAKGPDLGLMSRSDAVLKAMQAFPGPVDRNTIHEQMVDGGRFDSIDEVSLTLSGLKRSGRVNKLGHGLWTVAEDASTAESRG